MQPFTRLRRHDPGLLVGPARWDGCATLRKEAGIARPMRVLGLHLPEARPTSAR